MVRSQGSRSLNADEQTYHGRRMSSSPLAETAIARDLENYADNEDSINNTEDEEHSEASTVRAINSQPGTTPPFFSWLLPTAQLFHYCIA